MENNLEDFLKKSNIAKLKEKYIGLGSDDCVELTEKMVNDIKILNSYKYYVMVRRNLREAHSLVRDCISFSEEMKKLNGLNDQNMKDINAKMCYAILLYCKWFQKIYNNDNKLEANKFDDQNFLCKHNKIMNLRNKSIVHSELDVMEKDYVYVIKNNDNIEIESFFSQNLLIKKEDLCDLEYCIVLVHNKIDKEIIPDLEGELKKEINI